MLTVSCLPPPHAPRAFANLCRLIQRRPGTAVPAISFWSSGADLYVVCPAGIGLEDEACNVSPVVAAWALACLHECAICVWPAPMRCLEDAQGVAAFCFAGIAQAVYHRPFRPDLDLICLLQALHLPESYYSCRTARALAESLGPCPFASNLSARWNDDNDTWALLWTSRSAFVQGERESQRLVAAEPAIRRIQSAYRGMGQSHSTTTINLSAAKAEAVAEDDDEPLVSFLAAALIRRVSSTSTSASTGSTIPSPSIVSQKSLDALKCVFQGISACTHRPRGPGATLALQKASLRCFFTLISGGDPPPLCIARSLRGQVWVNVATELDFESRFHAYELARMDAEDFFSRTGRQLKQDLPRCHHYHPLVRDSQQALESILLAWSAQKPEREYWQGLDSLAALCYLATLGAAPDALCVLNFLTENVFAHLFESDNSVALNSELDRLHCFLRFIDPALSLHLAAHGVELAHFSVPWLLTGFAHVLPLESSLRLFDALLLGAVPNPASFACFALVQLRRILLSLGDFGSITSLLTRLPVAADEFVDQGVCLTIETLELFPFFPRLVLHQGVVTLSLASDEPLLPDALFVDVRARSEFLQHGPIRPGAIHFAVDERLLVRDLSIVRRMLAGERDARGCRVLAIFGPDASLLCQALQGCGMRFIVHIVFSE